MKKYCLIGEKLGHSYSALIHGEFGYRYDLVELTQDELENFAKSGDFDGFNVTIPYKTEIMKYLDEIDDGAKEIGAVNTVKRKAGRLYGYNTDIFGMEYALESKGISLNGKKVVILGSGGTSKTAATLAARKNAREIVVVSRGGENNYENLSRHYDAEVIINTTPVGMYPNNGQIIVDTARFTRLESVFDAVYNPLLTPLLAEAKKRELKYSSGLKMLIAQAKYARDIFVGGKISDEVIEKIYKKLYIDTVNIVLVGMPSSGKTTVGKLIADYFGKKFVDTDAEIEKEAKKSVKEIFAEDGEKVFRQKEADVLAKVGKERGQVIATGGGAVMGENAYYDLKQNGVIVYLTRDLDKAEFSGRPLLEKDGAEAIRKLSEVRRPVYLAFADIIAENNGDISATVEFIREKLYENTCN